MVVDAGLKAHATDHGMPTVVGYPGGTTADLDEDGVLTFEGWAKTAVRRQSTAYSRSL